jgi:hypothetical protein
MYTCGVRVRLYSKDSNPAIDTPLCSKSQTYVADLVANGQAVMLDFRSAQLLTWHSRPEDTKRELRGSQGDWCISDCSLLPHGQLLRITTRQRVS